MADDGGAEIAERLLSLLRRFGWNAMSFQILEDGFSYWFDGDAVVAYVDTGAAWVAAGSPIAAPESMPNVAARFCDAAHAIHKRACFFGPEQRFINAWRGRAMIVGEQAVWNPESWEAMLRGNRNLKEQLRRARAKGVQLRRLDLSEITSIEHPTRQGLDQLVRRWLATRPLAPMAFVVRMEPFSFAAERRYFIAECNGRIVGLLALVPIYARAGWLLDDLLRDPGAPNGVAESLIDAAMRTLAAEKCSYATLGLAPLAGVVRAPLRAVRRASRALYNFSGLLAFKSKLHPKNWDPIYIAYEGSGAVALFDVLSAFADGPLWRFGLATLMRGPAVVVRMLTLLLVPWTTALAVAPATYFPSRATQAAWVAFDIILVAALLSLTKRYRRWLSTMLAVVVTGDALMTFAEIILFNARHPASALECVACGLSVLGPSLAALLLWRARLHHLTN